ncbi:MAG: murein L,D-transpeptidase catalytic domain family protein [Pseudoxanthomonas sp.]
MSLHLPRVVTCLLLPLLACSAAAQQRSASEALVDALSRSAPKLDRKVLSLATRAMACSLRQSGAGASGGTLSVIDYSRPSTEPRLWVFDLVRPGLLFEEWVAHGRNTGENLATRFSNTEGSYMSSLGGFETEETYVGHNGYSLRLRGLEQGFNDQARERAIVIHGAPYVSNELVRSQGRLGRSLGCPAVRTAVAKQLIDTIRGGSFVFAYYPDPKWLQQSQLLDAGCGMRASAALAGAVRHQP